MKEYPLSNIRSVKRLGIPDSQIILMVADDMACNPRKYFIIISAIEHTDSDPLMAWTTNVWFWFMKFILVEHTGLSPRLSGETFTHQMCSKHRG